MNRRVLVTGGAGFIGSHCVDALLARGEKVTVLDIVPQHDAIRLAHCAEQITYIEGDIRDREVSNEAVEGHSHILHLAALVSVPRSIEDPITAHDTNVTGTLNVFDAARHHHVERVVYASSAAVYGATDQVPTHEEVPAQPSSPYGLHKHINEQYARLYHTLYGLSTCGLRFFNVYGSRQDPTSPYSGVISIFMKRARGGDSLTVYGDGSATRDFVHVHDVVASCLAALDEVEGGGDVFNVGTGVAVSLNELIVAIGVATNHTCTTEYHEPRAGDILHSCADIRKITAALHITPHTKLTDGLREIIQHQ